MPDVHALATIGKALAMALPGALLFIVAVGGVASLFRDSEDAETLRRLAQRNRTDFIRRGRWVGPSDIDADPDLITRDLHHRRN